MKLLHKNGKTYAGAGIILLEKMREPRVILFYNRFRKQYEDTGGRCEPFNDLEDEEILQYTVSRETQEESLNLVLVKFEDNYNYYVELNFSDIYYRVYFAYVIPNIIRKDTFTANKLQLKSKNLKKHWNEIDDMDTFNLRDLVSAKREKKYYTCKNCRGIEKNVSFRTVNALKIASRKNLFNQIPLVKIRQTENYEFDKTRSYKIFLNTPQNRDAVKN